MYDLLLNELLWVRPQNQANRQVTNGPDRDVDGQVDLALDSRIPVESSYQVRLRFSNPTGFNALIKDTYAAEWALQGWTDENDNSSVSIEKLGKKDLGASRVLWTPDPTTEDSELLLSLSLIPRKNGKLPVEECGPLYMNKDGATVFELDENGKVSNSAVLVSNPLCLVTLPDLNGGGVVGSGLGDEDGDLVNDWTEACYLGTNPCVSDTDGDLTVDGLDNCPLVPNNQSDLDQDGAGDECDVDPLNPEVK